ncbi:MAG: TIGR03619 family F420-dependent LLM class oxidoreductase [Actinomycetota bacterium]
MEIGVMMFPTDRSIQPVPLAVEAEHRGFQSLWFPEHSHIPSSRVTPWGGREGAPPLPEEYWRSHDQFVALAAAAGATSTIKLATGITLVAQRDPLWLAKEVASLDMISGGRFILGIGYGWNVEEMANHGLAYGDRRAVVRENILACKRIWTDDEFHFSGEHVTIEPSWSWPKPIQRPHPPILMGANPGPKTMAHIIEYCDGWMPIHGRYDIPAKLDDVTKAWADGGRAPGDFRWGVFACPAEREWVDRYREAGAGYIAFALPSNDADDVLPRLDKMANLL